MRRPGPVAAATALIAMTLTWSDLAAAASSTDIVLRGVVRALELRDLTPGILDADRSTPKTVAGAAVQLSWQPGLRDARIGDELETVLVAAGTTNGMGQYQLLGAPSEELSAEARRNGGWVNLDLSVRVPSGSAIGRTLPLRIVNGNWANSAMAERMVLGGDVTIATSLDGSAIDGDVLARDSQILGRPPEHLDVTPRSVTSGSVPCSFVVTGTPVNSVRVLNFHNASNALGKWSYGTTADSDIDVAFDSSGNGSWGVRGSVHVGNSTGATIHGNTNHTYNQYTRTDFKFVDGYYKPYGLGSYCNHDISVPVWSERKTAVEWWGGVGDDPGSGSEARNCFASPQSSYRTDYPVGTGLRRSTSRATRISFVADLLPGHIGGVSGYSTFVTMSWDSLRGRGIYLCGTTGPVTGSFGVMYAQNRP